MISIANHPATLFAGALRRKSVRVALYLSVLLFLATLAFGQADLGRLSGVISDESGAVISNAKVLIRNEKTAQEWQQTTSSAGEYSAPNLPPSHYTVSVAASSMASAEIQNVILAVGQQRVLNVTMRVASARTSVVVSSGEVNAVETASATRAVNVGEREVNAIPVNGRSLSQLYLMAPGATTAGGGTYDNIRFSGRSNQENEIRIDGIEASSVIDQSPGNLNGETSSGFRLQASLETVQEFRVDSSTFPAEYGTGTGGQITVVTKSGGNAFHGSLFEYDRNSAFDARNFFSKDKVEPLRLNQFGGSVGGPIAKDKSFFFFAYEGIRQRAGFNLLGQVPSDAARARAVPAIRPLLGAFPKGIFRTANPDWDVAQLVGSNKLDENSYTLRLDHRFNDKYSMFFRAARDYGEQLAPFDVSGSAFFASALAQNAAVDFQQILRPNLINDTRFGFNNPKTRSNGIAPQVPGVDLSDVTLSVGGPTVLVGIGSQGASAGIATPSGLVRANSATNGRGQPYTNYSLSFVDNLSWVHGNHTSKFGGEIRPIRLYTDRLGGVTYSFATLDDFLANRTSGVSVVGDVSSPSPYNGGATRNRLAKAEWYVGYAQDEWKYTPHLTFSYGLRYEYYTPLREDQNQQVLFNTETGTLRDPSESAFRSSTKNFAPRLGIAWSPQTLHDKTTFHIGAGYYHGPGQVEDQIQPIESDRANISLGAGTLYPVDKATLIKNFNYRSPTAKASVRAYAPGYLVPENVLQYNATIEQTLPGNTILSLAYVGAQGRNLFLRSITNQIVGVRTNLSSGAAIVDRRFGDQWGEIDFKTSGGTDHYDALEVQVNRRYSKGLTIGGQYTWGKSIGNSDGSNEALTATDITNYQNDRGPNNTDIRHSYNVNALYELPVGRGKPFLSSESRVVNALVSGWEIGGVINGRSGIPLDIRITRPDVVFLNGRDGKYYSGPVFVDDRNGKAYSASTPRDPAGNTCTTPGAGTCGAVTRVTTAVINVPGGGATRDVRRPDIVPGADPFSGIPSDKRFYINPAAFSIPRPGTIGNLGRNRYYGPSLFQLDFTVHKTVPVNERVHAEFRAEFFNILNHTNFANPPVRLASALPALPGASSIQPGQPYTAALAGGSFGVANATVDRLVGLGTSRQIQLSLRLNF